jgi:hypothetical protein
VDGDTFSDTTLFTYNKDGHYEDLRDDAEVQVYTITSYREFDKPDAYFDE